MEKKSNTIPAAFADQLDIIHRYLSVQPHFILRRFNSVENFEVVRE